MADGNVFTNTQDADFTPDVSTVTLETLVGETQKYKSPDDLAKAYIHADAAINALKAKEAEREAENKVLRDLLEAAQNRKSTSGESDPDNKSQSRQPDTPPVVDDRQKNDDKDIATLVQAEIQKANSNERFAKNVNEVSSKLAEHFGSAFKANEFIKQKAAELEVSVDWLMDMAGRSPSALYNTVGIPAKTAGSTNSPNVLVTEGVNTNQFRQQSGQKNFKYYEQIRKENPSAYYNSQLQQQMFNDRRTLGDAFYS